MPGLPTLILDAAELGADVARGGGPSSNRDVAATLEKKHEALRAQQIQTELQMAEIEKFHRELTGHAPKEASSPMRWVTL